VARFIPVRFRFVNYLGHNPVIVASDT
jgi:hypothetical protein